MLRYNLFLPSLGYTSILAICFCCLLDVLINMDSTLWYNCKVHKLTCLIISLTSSTLNWPLNWAGKFCAVDLSSLVIYCCLSVINCNSIITAFSTGVYYLKIMVFPIWSIIFYWTFDLESSKLASKIDWWMILLGLATYVYSWPKYI